MSPEYNLSRLLASKFSSIISLMPGLVGVGIMSPHHTELSSPTPLHAAPTARRFRINQQPLHSTWTELVMLADDALYAWMQVEEREL